MEDPQTLLATKWWFLSFYANYGTANARLIGGAIVEGLNIPHACHNASELDANPGGTVIGHPYNDQELPDDSWRERLLTGEETQQVLALIERIRIERSGHRTDN